MHRYFSNLAHIEYAINTKNENVFYIFWCPYEMNLKIKQNKKRFKLKLYSNLKKMIVILSLKKIF